MRTKNKIISGIVNEARHTFRISVNDSLYKAINIMQQNESLLQLEQQKKRLRHQQPLIYSK